MLGVLLGAFPGSADSFGLGFGAEVGAVDDASGVPGVLELGAAALAGEQALAEIARKHFHGTLMGNGGFDFTSAQAAIQSGQLDAVVFGKPFISNANLVERFKSGAALNPVDFTTLYSPGANGYTDYPA